MKNISFSITLDAFADGAKDVTRRNGWHSLRAGDRLRAVDKVMGFKKGEKPRTLGTIEVVSVRRERLDAITDEDVIREGFPGHDAAWFVAMYCKAMDVKPGSEVTRIEFRKVGP